MKTVPCKGCGRSILWATDEKGTRHPLDARAPCYSFNGGDLDGEFKVHRSEGTWCSHFATCSKAGQFSRGKRKPADAVPER